MQNFIQRLKSALIMLGLVGVLWCLPYKIQAFVLVLGTVFLCIEWYHVIHERKLCYAGGVGYIVIGMLAFTHMAWHGQSWIPVMALAWVVDTSAYLGGSWLGGEKLAPRISPGKTLSGFICGMVVAVLWVYFVLYSQPLWYCILWGLCIQGGDLLQSWIKRRLKIKDMGSWIPGHGGSLDRFDSTIALGWGLWIQKVIQS